MRRTSPNPCVVDECTRRRQYRATGLCVYHQRRANRGMPLDTPARFKGETFESHFTKGDGCWEWTGYCDPNGYGRSKQEWAHRASYERYVGPIPAGLHIDHLCRNPKCVNPAHLEAVAPRTNWFRGYSPTAISVRTNYCKRGHEWTPENTYLRPDNGMRQCRACIKLRTARRTNGEHHWDERTSQRGAA